MLLGRTSLAFFGWMCVVLKHALCWNKCFLCLPLSSLFLGIGLPEELWLKIFSFLSSKDVCRLGQVCRGFFRLHLDSSLWRHIRVSNCRRFAGKDLLRMLQNSLGRNGFSLLDPTACKNLLSVQENLGHLFSTRQLPIVHISVPKCESLVPELWPIVLPLCPRLRHLDVSGCSLSPVAISAIALCTGLRTLYFRNVKPTSEENLGIAFVKVLQACLELEDLDVTGCAFAQNVLPGVCGMLHNCKLQSLRGISLTFMDAESVAKFTERCPDLCSVSCTIDHHNTAIALCSTLPKLRHLEVTYAASVRISPASATVFQGSADSLSSLSIVAKAGMSEDVLHPLLCAVQPHSLTSLSVSTTYGLTDIAAIALGSCCPNLSKLVCESPALSEAAILTAAASCSHIVHLHLAKVEQLRCEVFEKLTHCLRSLRHVSLPQCNTLGNRALCALAANCPQLRHANFSSCTAVTDEGFSTLAIHCHQLQHIALDGSPLLTDKGVFTLASNCPDLLCFRADSSSSITDRGVAFLAQSCTNLQCLSLKSASQLSQTALRALAHFCGHLSHLDVTGAVYLCDKAIGALAKSSITKQLTNLGIGFGDDINLHQLLKLLRSCTRLRQLVVVDHHVSPSWSGQSHWRRRVRNIVRSQACQVHVVSAAQASTEAPNVWEDFVDPGGAISAGIFKKKEGSANDLWWRWLPFAPHIPRQTSL